MPAINQVIEIFAGSRRIHLQARAQLDRGDIRAAAEKAWHATDARILARTGRDPQATFQTSGGWRGLARNDERCRSLRQRYAGCISERHAGCCCDSHSEPEDLIS